jgi:hypothetical protein
MPIFQKNSITPLKNITICDIIYALSCGVMVVADRFAIKNYKIRQEKEIENYVNSR